jgi:hypothetical protein
MQHRPGRTRQFAMPDDDPFLNLLRSYARENLEMIRLAGLSALARILGVPPPSVEHIILPEHQIDTFIKRECSDQRTGISLVEGSCVSVGGKCAIVCTFASFQPMTNSVVELIILDVRDGAAEDLADGAAFGDLDSKIVQSRSDISIRPIAFWKCFVVVSHLPGFRIQAQSGNASDICGCIAKRPLYRFDQFHPGGFNRMSFGGRVITHAVTAALSNVSFPFLDFVLIRHEFYNIEMFAEIAAFTEVDEFAGLWDYFEKNKAVVGPIDVVVARFAILTMPLYYYQLRNRKVMSCLTLQYPGPPDWDTFCKLVDFKIRIDKGPLAAWFWLARHNFHYDLVFRAIEICSAFEAFSRMRDFSYWLFVERCEYWRELLAFVPPLECHAHFAHLNSFLPAELGLNPPDSELEKLFPANRKFQPREMRKRVYAFFTGHVGASLDDFRASFLAWESG